MLNNSKLFNQNRPSILLCVYNILSLFVLLLFIIIVASLYTLNYIKDERNRSAISYKQLAGFFDFQYRAMSEESWSENYESISMRVKDITKRFGDAPYSLFILDANNKCLANSSKNVEYSEKCVAPLTVINDLNSFNNSHLDSQLKFDFKLHKYVYVASLKVGDKLSSYLYVEINDPYNFYRGTIFSKLWHGLFLKLSIATFIWLLWMFISWKFILKPYYIALINIEKKHALAIQAANVAHDINSPLAVLEMISQMLSSINEEDRVLIKGAIDRIRDIARSLLTTHKETVKYNSKKMITKSELSCQHIGSIIESILIEKRYEFRERKSIVINVFEFNANNYFLFAKIPLSDFKRALSNLINNAIDSIMSDGIVSVVLNQNEDNIEISINDNGVGIPPEIISKLGQEGLTYGKLNGNGLGFFSAKKMVESCGGSIVINSELEKGSSIKLILPKTSKPEWFMSSLIINSDSIICVIDKDPSTHQVWRRRFLDIGKYALRLHHFANFHEFQNWHLDNKYLDRNIIYLFSNEFVEKGKKGLDNLKKLSIKSQRILVTSQYQEKNIQEMCSLKKIKLLPKNMAEVIPIIFEATSVVS